MPWCLACSVTTSAAHKGPLPAKPRSSANAANSAIMESIGPAACSGRCSGPDFPTARQRPEQVLAQVSDDLNHHPIARDVVGRVVMIGQPVIVGQPHEASRFKRRKQPGAHGMPFNHDTIWRLEPPWGVRKQPATSKRTSARWTLPPFPSARVRL